MNKILVSALVLAAVTLTSCKRNTFDYARTKAPQGAPEYTFQPDINQPGVSKPAEETK